MNTQPEALRLADELTKPLALRRQFLPEAAAAELRRLHAEIEVTERQVEILTDALAEASKANRELLEALGLITEVGDRAATEIARAAIAKATGEAA